MINTKKIVNDIIGRNKETFQKPGKDDVVVAKFLHIPVKTLRQKYRSKCCGTFFRKTEDGLVCSNCNLSR